MNHKQAGPELMCVAEDGCMEEATCENMEVECCRKHCQTCIIEDFITQLATANARADAEHAGMSRMKADMLEAEEKLFKSKQKVERLQEIIESTEKEYRNYAETNEKARLALSNAVYLAADWSEPFRSESSMSKEQLNEMLLKVLQSTSKELSKEYVSKANVRAAMEKVQGLFSGRDVDKVMYDLDDIEAEKKGPLKKEPGEPERRVDIEDVGIALISIATEQNRDALKEAYEKLRKLAR